MQVGRPTIAPEQKRDQLIHLAVSSDEKAELWTQAARRGLSLSGYIRGAALGLFEVVRDTGKRQLAPYVGTLAAQLGEGAGGLNER